MKHKTPAFRPYEQWRTTPGDHEEDAANLFGYYLIRHCRSGALEQIPRATDSQTRALVENAVDTALHNVMDLLEGFWPLEAGSSLHAELELHVKIMRGEQLVESVQVAPASLDLPIGYWAWRDRQSTDK